MHTNKCEAFQYCPQFHFFNLKYVVSRNFVQLNFIFFLNTQSASLERFGRENFACLGVTPFLLISAG